MSGRVFYLWHSVSTPCHSKKLPVGSLFVSVRDCLCELSWPPPAFAFSSRQRLHWTGPVSCWHHYHLNTADVVSVRAHSVSAVCACHCLRKTTATPTTCARKIPFVYLLACPRIAHGHTPAAALDRSTSSFEPGESCFPHPPTPLLLARSRRRAELHHRDNSDYRVSLRSDRAKPTIFVTLFDRLYCLNC